MSFANHCILFLFMLYCVPTFLELGLYNEGSLGSHSTTTYQIYLTMEAQLCFKTLSNISVTFTSHSHISPAVGSECPSYFTIHQSIPKAAGC